MSKKKKYAVFVPFASNDTTAFGDKHWLYDVKKFFSLQLAKKEQQSWYGALVVEIIVGEIE